MSHIPLAELNRKLAEAARQVAVGARYSHYKHPEQPYVVTSLVVLESNDEVAVAYSVEEGDERVTFVRPLANWLETVEVNGLSVPRFTRVR